MKQVNITTSIQSVHSCGEIKLHQLLKINACSRGLKKRIYVHVMMIKKKKQILNWNYIMMKNSYCVFNKIIWIMVIAKRQLQENKQDNQNNNSNENKTKNEQVCIFFKMKNIDNGIIMMDRNFKGSSQAKSKSSASACAFVTINRFAVLDSSGEVRFILLSFCLFLFLIFIYLFFFFFFFRFN